MSLKETFKKSKSLHRTYKFIKLLPEVSASRLLEVRRSVAIWKVLPNTMLPLERLFSTYDCVEMVNKERIPGDIVECGVWSGGCMGLMALADSATGETPRQCVLFDSFEGLPQPTASDGDVFQRFQQKRPDVPIRQEADEGERIVTIDACVGARQPEVERFLTETLSIDKRRLTFYSGWFQDTVYDAAQEISQIAILRLDGDWYESTKVCIEGLYDLVAPGGFVIVDDYGTFSGCRKAIDEFRKARKINSELIFADGECCYFRVETAQPGANGDRSAR